MDVELTSDVPAAVFETGHFGAVPHPPTANLTGYIHELRRRARILARDNDPHLCFRERFGCTKARDSKVCPVLSRIPAAGRVKHFEQQLKDLYCDNHNNFYTSVPWHNPRVTNDRLHNRTRYCPNEHDNDVELARSDVPLPGERNHRRTPSLERQEAFYDRTTARGKIRVQRCVNSEDAEIAALYSQGLLYNSSEDVKNSLDFDLNAIRHSEPTFIIRPAKRARKSKHNAKGRLNSLTYERPLHLDLSFSDIGDDEAIARYFFASQQASPDDLIQHGSSQESTDSAPPPLRVIYELAGSQGSVDVDASQPPDLMLDDDFDVLSTSDMQDTPDSTQHSDDPASAAWVMVGDDL